MLLLEFEGYEDVVLRDSVMLLSIIVLYIAVTFALLET